MKNDKFTHIVDPDLKHLFDAFDAIENAYESRVEYENNLRRGAGMFDGCEYYPAKVIAPSEAKKEPVNNQIPYHIITWILLTVVIFITLFKSFDVSIDVKNPVRGQEIQLSH